jgi:RNA polymerase sigma-70 factor, ECF subfamily
LAFVTMLRITRIETSDGRKSLRVEGRLTRDTAGELRMACNGTLDLDLDVSGLQFVDPTGIGLLHGLERGGARLAGSSGFLNELLRERPATADDEASLIAGLRAGDADAFERMVRRYGGRMLATARRIMGNEDAAHDVVQDACLAAFRAMDDFAGAARLSTWLHRIVVNAALMKLRSRRRRPEESIEELLPRFDETGHFADAPSAWDASTDRAYERAETRAMVRAAIQELPPSYRTVLLLRDIEELDTEETASTLGISQNAVKVRLHRARQALRTLLERRLANPASQVRT